MMATPATEPVLPTLADLGGPNEQDLYKCIHCGFCLEACPTYVETGLETESPRGRLALMKAVHEGRIDISTTVYRHWDLCIQCRACEAVCPSGVPYGQLIEATMAQVEPYRKMALLPRMASNIVLKRVLTNQGRLSLLVGALRMYQRSGLQRLVRRTGLLERVSKPLADLERSLPALPAGFFVAEGQGYAAFGEKRARVALLSGCVMPLVQGPEMRTVARVLSRNGCEVVVPKEQVCCGALNTHMGDLESARKLARRNIDAFLAAGVDAIVVASAGCGIRMKEYDHLLRDDPEYGERAARFVTMVKDVHEFLVDLPFIPPQGALDYRVTYQDSCHLAHTQGIIEPPRTLLSSIPGLTFTEMANSSRCCGAGGTYTITQRDFSLRLLDSKMKSILDTGADVVATANPGCVLQLKYGSMTAGAPSRVCYVTDLLDEAYRAEPRAPRPADTPPSTRYEEERQELRARWRSRPGDRRRRTR